MQSNVQNYKIKRTIMKVKSLKLLLASLALIIACPLYAESEATEQPAVHGMLVFGKQKMYASHLPMYHSPHDYQVIFELSIDNVSSSLLKKEQKKYPNDVTYTLEPEPFVLTDMIEHPVTFLAKIYRGHFERGGYIIADNVTVTIEKIIYAKKLTNQFPAFPPVKSTSYILFGNEKEQFAAHLIRSKPSFDHVVQISSSTEASFFPEIGMINSEEDTVPDIGGNHVSAVMHERNDRSKYTNFYWQKQIYLEFTDLK